MPSNSVHIPHWLFCAVSTSWMPANLRLLLSLQSTIPPSLLQPTATTAPWLNFYLVFIITKTPTWLFFFFGVLWGNDIFWIGGPVRAGWNSRKSGSYWILTWIINAKYGIPARTWEKYRCKYISAARSCQFATAYLNINVHSRITITRIAWNASGAQDNEKKILLFSSCASAQDDVLRLLMTCNTGFIHKMVQYVHLYVGWPSNVRSNIWIWTVERQCEDSYFSPFRQLRLASL